MYRRNLLPAFFFGLQPYPLTTLYSSSTDKMVYYFTSNVVSPAAFIYVGKDKFESTVLLRPLTTRRLT